MATEIGDLVKKHMGQLIATHALEFVSLSGSEALLRGEGYAIKVIAYRDGVSMVYFDTSRKPAKGYNLFLFLSNKRGALLTFSESESSPASYEEFVGSQIESLSRHLQAGGQDILRGSKEWISSYSWPAVNPDAGLAKVL